MRGREKMGGGERRSIASDTISAAHLFPLLPRARHVIPRRAASSGTSFSPVNAVSATRSVERNLQRTPSCLRGRRTSISLRIATKKYYFCTVEQSRMSHDRTYHPASPAPAPRLRDADGSMRQAPCRSAGYAATHPVQPLKGLPGTRATDVSYRALAPVLRQRKGLRNGFILLWFTLLQQ